MKLLYIDCSRGLAGDMLAASLAEIVEDDFNVLNIINSLNLKKIKVSEEHLKTHGISGRRINVLIDGKNEDELINHNTHDNEHHHTDLHDIKELIESFPISPLIKKMRLMFIKLLQKPSLWFTEKKLA